ncbi:hypothetical protein [Leifsonia sp. 22587]|uniref:hypothetical protein n=1 Tax=Leifsonia sp. 22587 TaxID=3453946 RepID=UPI003F873B69
MTETTTSRRRRPDGPNAGVLAVVSLALTIASVLVPPLLASGTSFPSPLGSTAAVSGYFVQHPAAASVAGFLVFAASVPLGIYAATVYARMQRLGIRVPGPTIALVGGIAASILLSISGLLAWALGQPVAGRPPALLHTLDYVVYALGGVGFVGGLGLLIAGIAVPALILGLAPRWLAWAGLILAGLSELSFFALLIPQLALLLPVCRFLGLAWLSVVGFLLPRDRHDVPRRGTRAGTAPSASEVGR